MASDHETIFTMEATPVKFGTGASADAGWELKRLGVRCAMLVTDPGVAALGHPERIKWLIEAEGIEVIVYDRARVESTIESVQDAVDFALEHEVDGFVSVGGGSSMDTAKVANLVSTHPAPVMAYVNPQVGLPPLRELAQQDLADRSLDRHVWQAPVPLGVRAALGADISSDVCRRSTTWAQ